MALGARASRPLTARGPRTPLPHLDPPWHSRGYLPHFDLSDLVQAVTFRLADSLPAEVVQRLMAERGQRTSTSETVDRYLDAGTGSCVLRRPEVARLVEDALLFGDGERYRLLSWVVMPNHVHVVVETVPGQTLAAVVQAWKSFTAHQVNRQLGRTGALWQPEYFDRVVRDERHLRRAISYVEQNPVTAGLVNRPQDWRFGSARRRLAGGAGEDARAPSAKGTPQE